MDEKQTFYSRIAALLVIGAYLHAGPAFDIIGHKKVAWGQQWRMFHGFGVGVCDVRFFDYSTSSGEPIDRYKALGVKQWTRASKATRRLDNEQMIMDQARKLCRRNQEFDLRVQARCGSRKGWKPLLSPDRNLCAGFTRKKRRSR